MALKSGGWSVELSGQLTIGSSALLGYGSDRQRSTYLPLIAEGKLIAFALTEVGVGVNAKRVRARVDLDEANNRWRLNAENECNKLYITSATYGGLAAVVARKGRTSRELGLFIVEFPDGPMTGDVAFSCESSNVCAFEQNINSRISFKNYPIPIENEIPENGVEVLFYCLKYGRCMLAAMCAGFQKMMAADAIHYANAREGVGGRVIKHELPRNHIARMLGGSLLAQSLSHASLDQDARGNDMAGLRDLTKSASAQSVLESLVSCERVIGGRSFDLESRISKVRSTIHAFGVVEGEDDLIRMGMVKEITAGFTDRYLRSLLSSLAKANKDKNGNTLPADERLMKLGLATFFVAPARSLHAVLRIILSVQFYRLCGWLVRNALGDLLSLLFSVLPTSSLSRYAALPPCLGKELRFAESRLRQCRWRYLAMNVRHQLGLTTAQIPMQVLGKRIEILTGIAVLACHVMEDDGELQQIALYQIQRMKEELRALPPARLIECRRSALARLGDMSQANEKMLAGIRAEPYAHPWD